MELTRTKFETAYSIVKETLPLLKYPILLKHEEIHGVEISKAYRNGNAGGLFIDITSENLADDLKEKLNNCNLYSMLTNGSTDAATENKVVFLSYFDPCPTDSDELEIETLFVKFSLKSAVAEGITEVSSCKRNNSLKSAVAERITESINDSFESIGVDDVFRSL